MGGGGGISEKETHRVKTGALVWPVVARIAASGMRCKGVEVWIDKGCGGVRVVDSRSS